MVKVDVNPLFFSHKTKDLHLLLKGQQEVKNIRKYVFFERRFLVCSVLDKRIHLKNVTAATKEGKTCKLGRGVIDIPAFVAMLRKIKCAGCCSLEYEKDMKDPLAGLAESAGYFKGVCAVKK